MIAPHRLRTPMAGLMMLAGISTAFTADYPTKPVQIINQAAPGSDTDGLGAL